MLDMQIQVQDMQIRKSKSKQSLDIVHSVES